MDAPVVEVKDLFKSYKGLPAVNGLSFTVPAGSIYGFLGQNGAGKSTTIRMLLSLVQPTAGTIAIFGRQLPSQRNTILADIGVVIEKPDLYKYLTALQNLAMMARLSGHHKTGKELMEQLETVGIADRANSKVHTFSQGMKQRLGIACALVHDPKLIILDEPMNGLDPQGIADVRNLILHLGKNEKRTVLLSSHLLTEMEMIADHMLIIDKGKKVAEGRVADLLNPADTIVSITTGNNTAAHAALQQSAWSKWMDSAHGELVFRMHRDSIPDLVRDLVAMQIQIHAIVPRHSLEAYFLSLTSSNQHVAAYQD